MLAFQLRLTEVVDSTVALSPVGAVGGVVSTDAGVVTVAGGVETADWLLELSTATTVKLY